MFHADRIGLTLFDDPASTPRIEATRPSERFVDEYHHRHLHAHDLVWRCVQDQQRAIRDLDVTSREHWLANPLYREIALPFGMVRCMQGPILGDGMVIGAVNVARPADAAFSVENLMSLASVSAHVSVQLARLRSMPMALARLRGVLTEREVEVSLLVAKGLTNEQIGHVLGVSANAVKGTLGRAFRKLGIESRVELVATLFDGL
ncbi:MAG TPA: LuxR C-terminal-related transcriptional regulator [Kofleriaceae bacterium]|nr:LuxR C-terminal-related transcriptional regulator [Kofleriaceae bacterium]